MMSKTLNIYIGGRLLGMGAIATSYMPVGGSLMAYYSTSALLLFPLHCYLLSPLSLTLPSTSGRARGVQGGVWGGGGRLLPACSLGKHPAPHHLVNPGLLYGSALDIAHSPALSFCPSPSGSPVLPSASGSDKSAYPPALLTASAQREREGVRATERNREAPLHTPREERASARKTRRGKGHYIERECLNVRRGDL